MGIPSCLCVEQEDTTLGSGWYGNSKKVPIYLFIKTAGRDFKPNNCVSSAFISKRELNLLAIYKNKS